MSKEIYQKLAEVLDTLPNGFPPSESGVELRLLEKIFDPEEAELFCELKLKFETPEQIAARTGRPVEQLKPLLKTMGEKGQVFAINFAGTNVYKMLPWVFGIYEFQLERIDREMSEMFEEYGDTFGPQFFRGQPALMQVVPVEREITAEHSALTYERVSTIIENSKSFAVSDCICKKEQGLMDKPCNRTINVCMAFAPVPGIFDNNERNRAITKEEAYALLEQAEKEALVHLTWNAQEGHFFICNCCGCCCGVLRHITEKGIPASLVVNSHYFAEIDPDLCSSCGTCADERCQVKAIAEGDKSYVIEKEKCIGCGLCISTCPEEAISLKRKPEAECVVPPKNENDWYEVRAKLRGRDFDQFK